jgi:membrane protein
MTSKLSGGIGGRVERLIARVMAIAFVRRLVEVMDGYDRAGGGLLASGLAFNSLFALLPAILLLIGLAGLVLGNPERLAALSADLSARFPPLAVFFQEALAGLAAGAVAYSVVGFIALIWGASRFYDSLDNAIGRIFEGSAKRNPIERGVMGVVVILVAIGLGMGGFVIVSVGAGMAASGLADGGLLGRLLELVSQSIVLNFAFFFLVAGLIYHYVPTRRPSWRAVGLPALILAILAALLTQLFALLAPRLVGGLQVYGAFVAILATMLWLSFMSQGLLIGAAWVKSRAPAEASLASAADGPVEPAEGD